MSTFAVNISADTSQEISMFVATILPDTSCDVRGHFRVDKSRQNLQVEHCQYFNVCSYTFPWDIRAFLNLPPLALKAIGT